MSSEDLQSTLSETEQWMLKTFINRFLPKSNNRRKYSNNELSVIHSLISEIFFRFRRVKISDKDLLISFALTGYNVYVCDQAVSNRYRVKSNKTGIGLEMNCFIYIGISSANVLNLKRALKSISYQKKQSKIDYLSSLKKEIHDFFIWNSRVVP